jgi:alkanesulfonate monooxygenase SsuD/methylene tetrahydromethanopterin reductase-like flavin-dependent oxidoreductase (luciferase family)
MPKFGFKFEESPKDPSFETLRDAWIHCEKIGFDHGWMSDHLHEPIMVPETPQLEQWTTLSAMAAVTRKVRIGTMITNVPFRYPSVLAKMAVTLDHISKGRLTLGLGGGLHKKEFLEYGIPFLPHEERAEQVREAIEIMKKIWTEDKASFLGKHYKIEEAECYPKPIQKPHPPIWVGVGGYGGKGKNLLRVAAQFADGCNFPASTRNFDQKIKSFEQLCREFGRDPSRIRKAWQGHVIVAKTSSSVEEKVTQFRTIAPLLVYREMSQEEWNRMGTALPWPKPGGIEWEGRRKNNLFGVPEELTKRINDYLSKGITDFICVFPDATDLEMIELFFDEVAARFID